MTDDVPWLTRPQLRAWLKLVAVIELLPSTLDSQLQRDADLTHFDYMVVAMLSETEGRTLRMSALAARTNASLPRLSHVVSRLEKRGYVSRCPAPEDRRATDVRLTDLGWDAIVAAAPGHVRTARQYVVDALSDEQVGQLDDIMRALLERLDPDGRLAALTALADPDVPGAAVACDGVTISPATREDLPTLRRATLLALNWTPADDGGDRFADADVDRPEFAHGFAGFDPERDRGVVARDGDGPVGAAWAVFLPASDPGYGFVAEDVPELTLALEARGRGRGIGSALLAAVLAAGRDASWRGISLSVEDGNTGARLLYERAGFRVVGRNGGSDTMLLEF
jgi:DNA-binding MarR family transcriptional regulator/GNAT superfamily N-acetyltransferase